MMFLAQNAHKAISNLPILAISFEPEALLEPFRSHFEHLESCENVEVSKGLYRVRFNKPESF